VHHLWAISTQAEAMDSDVGCPLLEYVYIYKYVYIYIRYSTDLSSDSLMPQAHLEQNNFISEFKAEAGAPEVGLLEFDSEPRRRQRRRHQRPGTPSPRD